MSKIFYVSISKYEWNTCIQCGYENQHCIVTVSDLKTEDHLMCVTDINYAVLISMFKLFILNFLYWTYFPINIAHF